MLTYLAQKYTDKMLKRNCQLLNIKPILKIHYFLLKFLIEKRTESMRDEKIVVFSHEKDSKLFSPCVNPVSWSGENGVKYRIKFH